jgi:hypothetical protein
MCISRQFHSRYVTIPRVFQPKFAIDKIVDIILIIAHNFAEYHVLKAIDGPLVFSCTTISPHTYIKGSRV